jgi:hypothetical protein
MRPIGRLILVVRRIKFPVANQKNRSCFTPRVSDDIPAVWADLSDFQLIPDIAKVLSGQLIGWRLS